jgi:hypothetical protein
MGRARVFSNVKGTNLILRVAQIKPVGRYLLSTSLSFDWETLDSITDVPKDGVWSIVAVYSNCITAKTIALSVIQQLRIMAEHGYGRYMPMPDFSDAFEELPDCAACKRLSLCRHNYRELDDDWASEGGG